MQRQRLVGGADRVKLFVDDPQRRVLGCGSSTTKRNGLQNAMKTAALPCEVVTSNIRITLDRNGLGHMTLCVDIDDETALQVDSISYDIPVVFNNPHDRAVVYDWVHHQYPELQNECNRSLRRS